MKLKNQDKFHIHGKIKLPTNLANSYYIFFGERWETFLAKLRPKYAKTPPNHVEKVIFRHPITFWEWEWNLKATLWRWLNSPIFIWQYCLAEILHHLRCMKPLKPWDKLPINWCRMSSINSITGFIHGMFYSTKLNIQMFETTTQTPPHLGVSKNNCTPKSSILIGFSILFFIHFGYPYFWKHHIFREFKKTFHRQPPPPLRWLSRCIARIKTILTYSSGTATGIAAWPGRLSRWFKTPVS